MHLVRNQGAFEYRGDGEFLGFLSTVAERVLINRRKFWNAQRRFSWNLLRLEWESRDELRRIEPVTPEHSPSSIFNAKLRYQRLVRAVALLPEMDREVLAMLGDGCTIEVTAARLGRSSGAAAKLRQRAVKRLAKAYRLVGKLDPDSDGHPPMEVSRD
ncbi:MAG: RNA polymerase sigma factor [Planctomycetota bacterium]